MDWQTMKQFLYRAIHQDTTSVPTSVVTDVSIAICDSIKHNRKDKYSFNQKRGTISTTGGQYSYRMPSDFLGLIGPPYYTPPGSSIPEARFAMKDCSVDEVEGYRLAGNDYNAYVQSGRPYRYAIDLVGTQMLVSPDPSEDSGTIDFRYIADIGSPVYLYDGSSWNFYEDESSSTAMTATSTNDWFKKAFDLISQRALYNLWQGPYGGSDESAARAQAALLAWTEAKLRLQGEENIMASKRTVRKYI